MLLCKLQRDAMVCGDSDRSEFGRLLHEPAMVQEVLALLSPAQGGAVLDLTVGTAGHSLAMAEAIGPEGLLVAVDADASVLPVAEQRLQQGPPCRLYLVHAHFSAIGQVLAGEGFGPFDAVLADLGVGTHQLLERSRGFSFDSEARLDMRYDTGGGQSAWDVVNGFAEVELADLFYRLGQERLSRQIAARICAERPIDTPAQLANLVRRVAARRARRRHTWRIHPATRVMMALRIHVNHEMEELDALLDGLPGLLRSGGRVAVITYHSLEARRVKQAWRAQEAGGLMKVLTRPPRTPTVAEVRANPRVRSAQLRGAQKIGSQP
jgi:16S rRNA (cytosine1402-N4)-methyltransferase